MGSSVLYMSVSVDGYVAGPNDHPGNPGGDGFDRLHEWIWTEDWSLRPGPATDFDRDAAHAGALLAGRRTVEQVDHWGGENHGLPIFVVSHHPPPPEVARFPKVTYVTDGIESAIAQAKTAAGEKDVLIHGAVVARSALEAGVLDEIQLHQVPVLFGGGLRLFDVLGTRVELDIVRVIDTPDATHLRYRVRR